MASDCLGWQFTGAVFSRDETEAHLWHISLVSLPFSARLRLANTFEPYSRHIYQLYLYDKVRYSVLASFGYESC